MNRRHADQRSTPKLSHEEAVGQLVEYTFGRLSPRMNAAVEAHVRECQICQRQGLGHAATEKRQMARRIRRLRPGKRRGMSRGTRLLIFLLLLIVIVQVVIIEALRGALPFHLPFGALSLALGFAAWR